MWSADRGQWGKLGSPASAMTPALRPPTSNFPTGATSFHLFIRHIPLEVARIPLQWPRLHHRRHSGSYAS